MLGEFDYEANEIPDFKDHLTDGPYRLEDGSAYYGQ